VRRFLVLPAFAVVAWGLCGATIGIARGLMPMESALVVHAVAAPLIAGSLAYVYSRHLAVTRPLVVGLAFVGIVILLDAGLVAPFIEKSWDMFRSPLGTWIPFALILLAAWGMAAWVMGPGPEWRWHATHDERRRSLPGDERMPDANDQATHAISIRAASTDVWPWLLQMGCDRGGWYSWDRLDNGGRPSADRILSELQGTAVGDVLPSRPGHQEGFEVLGLEAPRHLVLGAYFRFFDLAQLEWSTPRPERFMRATWTFVLEPLDDSGTRLLVRTRGLTRPWWLSLPTRVVGGPAHVIMQRRQLLNLKARAERSGAGV